MDWDEIHGFEAWAAVLAELIDAATLAFNNRDHDEKNAALAKLRDFIGHSPNDVAAGLDEIALRAIAAIVAKSWDEGVAEMHARSAELARLTKQIGAITASGNEAAASIRLEKARRVVDRATETIQSMNALRKQLRQELDAIAEAGGDDEVEAAIARIDQAIRAVQTMRNAVEKLG